MSQAATQSSTSGPPPRNLIDFGNHPDAVLLRLYGSLVKVRDAQV
jgi:hypothetical protein